ncbi:hypothetical protein FA13DRAFT_924556 [Coprinellus micaceus]|uniref:Uncharacterized protein n=1 Tax=Coprinellus micaceus TaxID=71717 RepID=A0A4Y7TTW9_COPMI|nr:hypothetical protein FA13DRAFT_924556 [Coprinellus micaceus]
MLSKHSTYILPTLLFTSRPLSREYRSMPTVTSQAFPRFWNNLALTIWRAIDKHWFIQKQSNFDTLLEAKSMSAEWTCLNRMRQAE